MSKKTKLTKEVEVLETEAIDETEQNVAVEEVKQEEKQNSNKAKQNDIKPSKKQKNPKEKFRLAKKISKSLRETGAELKNVTWPTFRKVMKQTGVVVAMVVIFTAILFGFDKLLELIFKALV